MKTQEYLIEIEMPDGDYVGAGWLQELVESDCNMEDNRRCKVTVKEISEERKNMREYLEKKLKDNTIPVMDKVSKKGAFHIFNAIIRRSLLREIINELPKAD